jgi:hypothetical protein
MAYGSVNADVITTSTAGGILGAGNASIMKNRIINGAMVIDQRNAGASTTSATNGGYTLDRWAIQNNAGSSKFTIQQNAGSVTPPTGFTNYLGVTSTSAYTVGSGEAMGMWHKIEGYNTADLGLGTANAKTITISFWVRSSLTGMFGGVLTNDSNNRFYLFSYTISAANTWEQKSVTITLDTTGTWATTNATGLAVLFGLGVGSSLAGSTGSWGSTAYYGVTGETSVVGTNGATWYLTGVQLEVGSSATGFEYVNYQTSLANCMRYYQLVADSVGSASAQIAAGMCFSGTDYFFPLILLQNMRAAPTMALVGSVRYFLGSSSATSSSLSFSNTTTNSTRIQLVASGTAGYGSWLQLEGGSGTDKLTASAEL